MMPESARAQVYARPTYSSPTAVSRNDNLIWVVNPSDDSVSVIRPAYTTNNQFQFNLTGQVGASYVVQASTNLSTTNWISLRTNSAPFTFVETNAALYPVRFYRALFLP